jgi:hypothetical protein
MTLSAGLPPGVSSRHMSKRQPSPPPAEKPSGEHVRQEHLVVPSGVDIILTLNNGTIGITLTAPSSPGTYTYTATDIANPAITGTLTIVVS